jgi:putative drug exporter of the RND superfamily
VRKRVRDDICGDTGRRLLATGFVPVKAIGLGPVLAVALDATIVRMLLVPAIMTMFGRYNWWAPTFLRRLHQRWFSWGSAD